MANAFQDDAFQDDAFQEPAGGGITIGLLTSTSALYAPTLFPTVSLGFLDSGSALYAPVVFPEGVVRVTQVVLEVVAKPDTGAARETQVVLEVLRRSNPEGGSQVIIVG